VKPDDPDAKIKFLAADESACGVYVSKDDLDVGACEQGIMFGYASDATEDYLPPTHSMATHLGKKLADMRKSGLLWWLGPDGGMQVVIEYVQWADGSVEPRDFDVVASAPSPCGTLGSPSTART
jgi:S-adenosylmethionine synthetase